MLNKSKSTAILSLLFVLSPPTVDASVISYTTESAFNAAVTGATTFNFEGIAPTGSYTMLNPVTVGGVTFADVTPGLAVGFVVDSNWPSANYGASFFSGQTGPSVNTVSVSFAPTTAIGFLYGSYLTANAVVIATLSTGDFSVLHTPTNNGTGTNFIGFTSSTPVTNVTFTALTPVLDFIRFTTVAAVPEPGTLALLGIGLAGFAFSRRRRQ